MELIRIDIVMKGFGLSWEDIKLSGVQVFERIRGKIFREFKDAHPGMSVSDLYIRKSDYKANKFNSGQIMVEDPVKPGPDKGKAEATVIDIKKKKDPWKGYSPASPGIEG